MNEMTGALQFCNRGVIFLYKKIGPFYEKIQFEMNSTIMFV
ncbi:hypothetical protein GCM10007140_24320 [Priestia taiwanensis]|uniref:Uncharacterized protein n=1 Tax=Priestia taiwanensis TaxID=1347902 RepID=A0A917ATL7_9BACI|nr:hypothetical protein GCM10007140_24320 [Priestia taiwanensis]